MDYMDMRRLSRRALVRAYKQAHRSESAKEERQMPQRKKTTRKTGTARKTTQKRTAGRTARKGATAKQGMEEVNIRRAGSKRVAQAIAARGWDFGQEVFQEWQGLRSAATQAKQVQPRTSGPEAMTH